ncbi:hypothetical protein RJ527_04675 [Thalassospiraceae bacterium LMO-SO8]|nr:hypothetical protein [Alphaproteobacteria bacterium LMO-S08]WND77044.1 hypothetical protein RJ527_04675 [Thalassospiraceae bacterium LMO-SO8]
MRSAAISFLSQWQIWFDATFYVSIQNNHDGKPDEIHSASLFPGKQWAQLPGNVRAQLFQILASLANEASARELHDYQLNPDNTHRGHTIRLTDLPEDDPIFTPLKNDGAGE